MNKQKFTKRMIAAIAPCLAVAAVLISKGKFPEVLLFTIGIFCGILIWRAYTK